MDIFVKIWSDVPRIIELFYKEIKKIIFFTSIQILHTDNVMEHMKTDVSYFVQIIELFIKQFVLSWPNKIVLLEGSIYIFSYYSYLNYSHAYSKIFMV